jgi:hypothetical protein
MTEKQCPKCHDTAIHLQQTSSPDADTFTMTAKYCDCPTAQLYLARLRQQFIGLKSRLSLVERDFLERMVHLAAEKAKTPEQPH